MTNTYLQKCRARSNFSIWLQKVFSSGQSQPAIILLSTVNYSAQDRTVQSF